MRFKATFELVVTKDVSAGSLDEIDQMFQTEVKKLESQGFTVPGDLSRWIECRDANETTEEVRK